MKGENDRHQELQKDINKLLEKGVEEGVFPAGAAGISFGRGKDKNVIIGFSGYRMVYPRKRMLKKNTFFDLASLTKPLATTMAVLSLIKEKKIDIAEKLPDLLHIQIKGEKNKISVGDILRHSSGFPAHREYFHNIKEISPVNKKKALVNLLMDEPLVYAPGTKTVYSDLGFMLLGIIIEKRAGCDLDRYVAEKILRPLKMEKKIFFNPLATEMKGHATAEFAATENCFWRKKILCGEVHDDNCYAMGGVAGHSGLFGNIEGVTAYTGMILDMWKGTRRHPNINKEDLAGFLSRPKEKSAISRALGFDGPARKASSCGRHLSKKSVGHLGFTGTSFWIDPEKDVVIVLLTNRVHPGRENIKIREFRPCFHDSVMEKLEAAGK